MGALTFDFEDSWDEWRTTGYYPWTRGHEISPHNGVNCVYRDTPYNESFIYRLFDFRDAKDITVKFWAKIHESDVYCRKAQIKIIDETEAEDVLLDWTDFDTNLDESWKEVSKEITAVVEGYVVKVLLRTVFSTTQECSDLYSGGAIDDVEVSYRKIPIIPSRVADVKVGINENSCVSLSGVKSIIWKDSDPWVILEIPVGSNIFQHLRKVLVDGEMKCLDIQSMYNAFYTIDVSSEAGMQQAINPNTGKKSKIDYFSVKVRDALSKFEYSYLFSDMIIQTVELGNLGEKRGETPWIVKFLAESVVREAFEEKYPICKFLVWLYGRLLKTDSMCIVHMIKYNGFYETVGI